MEFQSTPPRRRRLDLIFDTHYNLIISIHASAKEATYKGNDIEGFVIISIHASAKEATKNQVKLTAFEQISIHASAKEATTHSDKAFWDTDISIHASAKEATSRSFTVIGFVRFQSTPPRRRRQYHIYEQTILL